MRKTISCIIIIFAILFTAISAPATVFADSSDNAVIVMKGEITDSGFSVKVKLVRNDGISAMDIELVYDDEALTLIGIEQGTTLSSLQCITTNTETDKGYSIRPFKFNYSGDGNDYSTGNLFTLNFKANENAEDGTYKVSLEYERDKSVNYYENGEVTTRNLSIDSVEVKIKGSKPSEIATVTEEHRFSDATLLIISVVVFAVATAVAIILFITRKRKRWERI